jgi:hypothetical protein
MMEFGERLRLVEPITSCPGMAGILIGLIENARMRDLMRDFIALAEAVERDGESMLWASALREGARRAKKAKGG